MDRFEQWHMPKLVKTNKFLTVKELYDVLTHDELDKMNCPKSVDCRSFDEHCRKCAVYYKNRGNVLKLIKKNNIKALRRSVSEKLY